MIDSNRFSRVIIICCIALLFAVALWLLALSTSSQNIIPVAALQVEPPINTPTDTPTPTNTPTDTPTPTNTPTNTPTDTPTPTPTTTSTLAYGELTIEKTVDVQLVNDLNGNVRLDPGDTVRYSINYRSTGTIDLTNVKVIDDYDQTAIAGIAKITPGGVDDRNTISWNIGDLPVGGSGTITYEATFNSAFPPEGTRQVENQVKIFSDQTDAVSASFSIDVMIPNLEISKSWDLIGDGDVNANGQPDPGDTISYTITVINVGDVDASNILIRDDYDQKLLDQPASISDGGVNEGDIIGWEFDRLDAGQEISVTYAAAVISAFPVGKSTIKNMVTVSSQGTLPITAENSIEIEVAPTEVAAAPASASQSAGPTSEAISPLAQAWLAFGFLLAAMVGLIVFGILTYRDKEIPNILRDGYILTLIMGTVIILGLAGSVERSAIAGLIGTVAGYVLRSAVEGGGGRSREPETREPETRQPETHEPEL
jgi:uncharacterized repeat protein (TIGR01451 family)